MCAFAIEITTIRCFCKVRGVTKTSALYSLIKLLSELADAIHLIHSNAPLQLITGYILLRTHLNVLVATTTFGNKVVLSQNKLLNINSDESCSIFPLILCARLILCDFLHIH